MSRKQHILSWLITFLTVLAYILCGIFISQGFISVTCIDESIYSLVIQIFAIICALASLLSLIVINRYRGPEIRANFRLPKSQSAQWALGLTAFFYPAVFLFTGNTLFNFVMLLGLSEKTFQFIFPKLESFGLWSIALSAAGAFVFTLFALIKNKDRALILGLPLLPALIVLGFIAGEIMGHG